MSDKYKTLIGRLGMAITFPGDPDTRQLLLDAQDAIRELQTAQQEAEPVAYCFTDVNGRPVQFCEPPEHASPNDARTRTTLYTAPQPAKPAVPREPTENMLEAGQLALCGSIGGYEAATILKAWEAMIRAAPQPDKEPDDG